MNWKECLRLTEQYISRFEWPLTDGDQMGFDCNPDFTVNDIWGAVSWLWTWPGDYLLNMPGLKAFLELGPETIIGSGWSTVFGWVIFFMIIGLFSTVGNNS